MKLKCIGGPCDGQRIDCPGVKTGDYVRVREQRKYDPEAPIYLDPYKMSEMVTDIVHIYRIDVLAYTHEDKSNSKIYILLFGDMSIWQALEHQFK